MYIHTVPGRGSTTESNDSLSSCVNTLVELNLVKGSRSLTFVFIPRDGSSVDLAGIATSFSSVKSDVLWV